MQLHFIDWAIIAAFLLISLYIGLKYRATAGKSLTDFFLGGRNLPWYIAGISMVATTFAADTPLWVTEKIAQHGISGNWMWWNMLIGGMLTTFFFSRLWRRAQVLTELEFLEIRYSGVEASFLRGFKSVYMGVFLNAVVIGWVNVAMMKILEVFFDIPPSTALLFVGGLMVLVAVYSSLSGLMGVVITDTIQFTIAMVGCIILAVLVLQSEDIGGISGLKEHFRDEPWRLDFFPNLDFTWSWYGIIPYPEFNGSISGAVSTFSLSAGAFLSFMTVQWWASWYPGAEPGGGGYISQRMMSAKSEKDAIYATLFFQIAHYCLRPWPWIIVGLCALVLYPDLPINESGKGFVLIMRDYLPVGLKGLLLAAFLGAYMSTISTQLNWGSSYLTNDLYKRFIKREESFTTSEVAQKHYVQIARLFTVLIMAVAFFATTKIDSIDAAARFLINCGAGLGMVLILRWYWWRINAWSEIAATLAPFIAYTFCIYKLEPHYGQAFTIQNGTLFVTVGFTTLVWIVVTFLTKPVESEVLSNFYNRVKPDGWWKGVADKDQNNLDPKPKGKMRGLVFAWLGAIIMTYSILFCTGYLIFQEWKLALICTATALSGFIILKKAAAKTGIFDD